jgi:hypothetical protein
MLGGIYPVFPVIRIESILKLERVGCSEMSTVSARFPEEFTIAQTPDLTAK